MDPSRGERCCANCGMLCDYRLSTVAPTYKQLFDGYGNRRCDGAVYEPNRSGPPVLEPFARSAAAILSTMDRNSPPYKRQTYFNERIKQWMCEEPPIPEDDFGYICAVYAEHPEASTKEAIRRLLRLVNERYGVTRFTRKYFEKWLTIRYQLTGIKSGGQKAPDWLPTMLQDMFAQLEEPFERRVRMFGGRYSFPSYNFVFRRLFDLVGLSWFGLDFPPLKNAHKRKTIVAIWLQLTDYLGWPYINQDPVLFGEEVRVDIADAWDYGIRVIRAPHANAPPSPNPRPAPECDAPGDSFEDLIALVQSWEENAGYGH